MTAPNTSSSDPAGASQRTLSPGGWFAVPFAIRLWIALAFVITASIFAFLQSPRPDAFRRPPALLSFSWWRYPLEWNAPARLARVGVPLHAIWPVAGTGHIWAAGNKGMVIMSADGGQTWEQRGLQSDNVSTSPTPAPSVAPAESSLLNFLDFVPAAEAAERASLPTPTPTPFPAQRTANGSTSTPSLKPTNQADPLENKRLLHVYFNEQGYGEVISDTADRFVTLDGGVHWHHDQKYRPDTPLSEFAATRTGARLRSLRRVPLSEGYFVGITDWGLTFRADYGTWSSLTYQTLWTPFDICFLSDYRTGWLAETEGVVYRTTDGGGEWQRLFTQDTEDLHAVFFIDSARGWVAGSNGIIRTTSDGGITWSKQDSGTGSQLNTIKFLPGAQQGWIAGDDGIILSTSDGGVTWTHLTQGKDASGRYLRFPAPWYFAVLTLIVGLLLPRSQTPVPEPEESVADVLVSDRPLDSPLGDVLSFNSIALALSRFLRNENTKPPLTIAIIGEWGTGKSSLMNLLRADLRSYKFRPVWFNAWHHQKEEHMLASLLENIKLQAVPRWWSNRGLAFRARLLGIRGWRHWLPLVLLLFFIYVLLIYHFGREGTDASYAGLMNWLAAAVSHPLETASNLVPFVPLLAGIFAFLGAVWRGITAFGVKPASLLAGISSGASIRGLEAQTSFRQKFAVEFNDVTRALGKRSLLIFIDDLDRCRPENVLETLEAVNFLTTSGECFVVIGMAREYVERCVGRAFKDIAEEMIDDVDKRPSTNGEDQTPDELAKEKRIEFARQYLDKLINIEVPIPAAKQGQSLNLLLAGAYQPSVPEPKSRWQEFKSSTARVLARHWRVLPALTALAVLLTLGYFLAMSLIGQSPGSSATTQLSPTPGPSPSPTQTSTPTPTPSAVGINTPTPTPLPPPSPSPTPELLNERAEIIAGGRGLFSRSLLPAIALLMMLWIGVTILTRRPDLVVKDSPNFVDALKIWHPLIFSRQSTPRSIKRFMNRVRYLAMRQRSVTESESSWWRRLVKVSAAVKELPPEAAESVAGIPVDSIPDEALVALAAIEHYDRRMFISLTSAQARDWPPSTVEKRGAIRLGRPRNELLVQAREAHENRFGKFDVLKYRDRFVEMAASVEVR